MNRPGRRITFQCVYKDKIVHDTEWDLTPFAGSVKKKGPDSIEVVCAGFPGFFPLTTVAKDNPKLTAQAQVQVIVPQYGAIVPIPYFGDGTHPVTGHVATGGGRLYVSFSNTSSSQQEIQQFDLTCVTEADDDGAGGCLADKSFGTSFDGNGVANPITADTAGNGFWVDSYTFSMIGRMELGGSVTIVDLTSAFAALSLAFGTDLAADAAGNLYAVAFAGATTRLVRIRDLFGAQPAFDDLADPTLDGSNLTQIAVDSSGRLLVANDHSIARLIDDGSGAFIEDSDFARVDYASGTITDVDVDGFDVVYVMEKRAAGTIIHQIDPFGTELEIEDLSGTTLFPMTTYTRKGTVHSFADSLGIAVLPDGSFRVLENFTYNELTMSAEVVSVDAAP